MAQPVAPGAFNPGDAGRAGGAFAALPAFCRVAATLAPSNDSDIKIEVWLPTSGWNGKFQAVGNGAWQGSIGYAAMAEVLGRNYATSSTDTVGPHVAGRPHRAGTAERGCTPASGQDAGAARCRRCRVRCA